LLVLNEEIRDAIIKDDNRPTASLRVIARQTSNYLTMQQDGIYKAITGITSIDEVKRMTNRLDREIRLVLSLPEIVRVCNERHE
jgi:type II secretory ATPase GspE/PulE/Tfp pilus assembly ATPase PilB-like protein